MMMECTKCERTYDDAKCWTICPHNPLSEAADAVLCVRHDFFDCQICKAQYPNELAECEDLLRSVLAVCLRDGHETNWAALTAKVRGRLKAVQDVLCRRYALEGGDTCTPKTFRLSPEN